MDLKLFFLIVFLFPSLACDNSTPKESFDKRVYDEYHSKYGGIVVARYVDTTNHNYRVLKIRQELFGIKKKYFDNHSERLFNFIQVGDSLFKDMESTKLRIKRRDLDTVIPLDFERVNEWYLHYWDNEYVKKEFNIDD
ncbi:MAG: hypothetical protein AAGC43_16825 [Bacteroidota bacterium]